MVSGAGYDYVAACARIARDHYPERCARVVIANAPPWFWLVWRVVRPLAPDATRAKVAIARPGAETRAAVLAFADPDQVPAAYGGALADPAASALEARLADFVREPPF